MFYYKLWFNRWLQILDSFKQQTDLGEQLQEAGFLYLLTYIDLSHSKKKWVYHYPQLTCRYLSHVIHQWVSRMPLGGKTKLVARTLIINKLKERVYTFRRITVTNPSLSYPLTWDIHEHTILVRTEDSHRGSFSKVWWGKKIPFLPNAEY